MNPDRAPPVSSSFDATDSSIAAPAAVMALGIFAAAVLPHLPARGYLSGPARLLVCLCWAALVLVLARDRHRVRSAVRHPLQRFALGTWVAATGVVSVLLAAGRGAGDTLQWLAAPLALAASAMWIMFLPGFTRAWIELAAAPADRPFSGTPLLWTVSTQSIAIANFSSLPAAHPAAAAAHALIALGAVLYAAAAGLILSSFARAPVWNLTRDWSNTHCILHGALSITGLAAVLTGAVAPSGATRLWLATGVVFAIVEAIELVRAASRVRAFGWRTGLWTYDVSQWARNFTFGMFYAFTASVPRQASAGPLETLRQGVTAWGAWLVLALLAAEFLLWVTRPAGRVMRA